MRKALLISFALMLMTSSRLYAQFPQLKKIREKQQISKQAELERESARREAETGKLTSIPKPKAAVMNVDVQIVLSRGDYKTFADAKPNAINRITDGEPLWLYVKFNGKLGDYVLTRPSLDEPGKLKYTLFAEIGPQGDITALNQYLLQFSSGELSATELKINLAPGLFGRNKSIPVFLSRAGGGRPGVWSSEFRITNSHAIPRGLNDHLAKSTFLLDLSGGPMKYSRMLADYDSIILRGTTDTAKMPIAGTFSNASIKGNVLARLRAEGIAPVKFFFSGDEWTENLPSMLNQKQSRKVFAVYTYQKAKDCFYGVAEIIQPYDGFAAKYTESSITLQKDFRIQCSELN